MDSAHTGAYIRSVVDEVLEEWDIQARKVIATLSDNSSNMTKAFKMKVGHDDDDDDDNSEEDQEEERLEDDEIMQFEVQELDHMSAFSNLHRISCFAHTLQLVVNKLSECSTFKPVLDRAHAFIRKVNSSVKATERLVSLCGKNLPRTVQLGGVPLT